MEGEKVKKGCSYRNRHRKMGELKKKKKMSQMGEKHAHERRKKRRGGCKSRKGNKERKKSPDQQTPRILAKRDRKESRSLAGDQPVEQKREGRT